MSGAEQCLSARSRDIWSRGSVHHVLRVDRASAWAGHQLRTRRRIVASSVAALGDGEVEFRGVGNDEGNAYR